MTQPLQLAILPGDGIGEEITRPCVELVQQALRQVGEPEAVENWLEAGAGTYTKTGNALPDETIAGCRAADAILLAAMGDPNVRYEDGTEIVPQIERVNKPLRRPGLSRITHRYRCNFTFVGHKSFGQAKARRGHVAFADPMHTAGRVASVEQRPNGRWRNVDIATRHQIIKVTAQREARRAIGHEEQRLSVEIWLRRITAAFGIDFDSVLRKAFGETGHRARQDPRAGARPTG